MEMQVPIVDASSSQQYAAPQDEMEGKLADIWQKLLGIDRISRHDNFFTLGGDSLVVVKLLMQLRQIGLDTTVQQVFNSPNFAMLASKLTCYNAIAIPPNLITKDSTEITPDMLPLITVGQADIDTIIRQIPGGVTNIQDIYELTPLQNGILHNHLKLTEGDPYLSVSRLYFTDRTSLERYKTALQQVIERHDILRTAIFLDGLSEPAQVVLRQVPSTLRKIYFDVFDKPVLEQLSKKFNPNQYRLDLTQAPLIRLFTAPAESEGKLVALQLMHHAIIDHSTLERLQREIHTIMDGKTDLLTTPTPFRNLVAQILLGMSLAEHTQFFTEMLGDIDQPTLPFGLHEIHSEDSEINEGHLKLSQTLNDQLRTHARNLQVSLASFSHLNWAMVLAKACGGRKSIVFGTVLLGHFQTAEENTSVMGPLINILPIRLDIDEKSVGTAVRDTHTRLSALLVHEHASLVLAQSCSDIPVDLPLFSAQLNYRHKQKAKGVDTVLPGVSFLDNAVQSNYPLTLFFDDDNSSLSITVQVAQPLSAARICIYVQQALESLADALVHASKQPIHKLRVMPLDERTLQLHSWNQIMVTQLPVCCLQQLFEARVKCAEQTIAVEYNGQTLSYMDLNMQANRLAHYMIAHGVKPDDRVALCVDRSTSLIVAILGILKAGCAYVPLDPGYPSQRMTGILLDANPVFLIADEAGRNALGDHQIPLIDLEKPLPVDLPTDNPDITKLGITPANLAYVIYTSGSTGIPKGVMVEHQQIVRLFEATHNKFDFIKYDKRCLFHSISFAISFWEIWNAFYYGSQISIVPHNITRSADEFYDWICNNGITILNQTPSAFKMLMRKKTANSQTDRLRYIILAGEALDPSIAKEWQEKYEKTGTKLIKFYGNTETHHATIYPLETAKKFNLIGRPLPDLRIYLLDSCGEPVLVGAEGEIYISGARVARGYLNRAKLTEERFLPDPFSEEAAARMYRTGDLARYLSDGNLVILGRADQQVKIRGFRIEPGEIESRLVEHAQVREAAVQTYGNGLDARLIAYVVANEDDECLAHNLRSYLSGLLPDYMVPVAYICLPSLPFTPSGKLNRRMLPAPDDRAFAREQYEAPQGEMEEKLANIWREMLRIDRISRHDNFFALGGHSLLVVKLLEQLRQIGLDTTVRQVYDASTLAMLASELIRYKAVTIPPNLITTNNSTITPDILPLITLSQVDIDAIIAQVPGGVANIQDIYGLTPLQNIMLYHHAMAKGGDRYLIMNQLHFIDRASLERYADAMQQIIERHDNMRTAIFWDDFNEPAQVVLRQVPLQLTEINLSEFDKPPLEQLKQMFHPHHYRLELTLAPLIRLMAAPACNGNWVAVHLIHHFIIDYATEQRLRVEIRAIMDGSVDTLKTPSPYRHFVAQTRFGTCPDEHTRFFTEILGDIDEPTLPFGLNDIGQNLVEMNESKLELTKTVYEQLRTHAQRLQVTLASLCHLALGLVISKGSGRESIVFGTVLIGRLQVGEESKNAMGPMINALPLHLDIDERSVETAVRDTHVRLSALFAHEQAPLILAQRCSGIPAGLPLFSALLNCRHSQDSKNVNTSSHRGVKFLDNVILTHYPLEITLDNDDDSLIISVQVMTPLSATQIGAYIHQAFESLAEALIYSPKRPVRKLNVMPSDGRTLLLHSWNQITVAQSPVCCIHQLFEANAECDGTAIAVDFDKNAVSYSELNIQANQLAHYLILKGVKPDDRIALCVERSTAMIAAILGSLKAGCAYVPLDPIYSSQRLTNILLDANPIFLLADATGRNTLENHETPVIKLEESLSSNLPIDNPNIINLGLTSAHLAYIIYTSGSTGTPKGVMIEHRQIVRLFDATQEKFDFYKQDKWCLFHSFSFDVSVWEIWGALRYGSQLSILSYQLTRATDEFYDWICANVITVLNQTPSAFKLLMKARNIGSRLDRLRYIVFAGEELDSSVAKEWYEKYGKTGTNLVNMYGTTETTVHATFQQIETTEEIYSIGQCLPDLRLYLLDSFGEPVLLGAEGEIYLSGAGVARGYLNRPELTAERFLPDPFVENSEARMYRTGDLARYLLDGNLVYLGRADQQVKIRGFRIELGEIEARLIEHSDVHKAVVQPFGNGSDMRLVAYVVADTDTCMAQNLRSYLSTLLPDYMVPAAYVCLPSLPLTPSGKLDQRALPAPDDEAFARQQYEAPVGEIEEKMADIWRKLLNIDRISRYDNFFALGGHSLLLMNFVSTAKFHKIHIDVRDVYSIPILKNLAEKAINNSKRIYTDVVVPVRQHGNEIPLFLLPDGGGDISYAFALADCIDENIPVYALAWLSAECKQQPSSIEEMANEMVHHIKKVRPNGPYSIAGYCSGGILAFEITKQLIHSGCSVLFLGLIDTYAAIPEEILQLSETEAFIGFLHWTFPIFKTINDSIWWERISEFTLDKAVEEMHKINLNLDNPIDIQWELLLLKQRRNYQNMVAAYKIDSIPMKIHLFKPIELCTDNFYKRDLISAKIAFNYPKLGWENYEFALGFHVVPVDGNHSTVLRNSKNRSILGRELTKCLKQ